MPASAQSDAPPDLIWPVSDNQTWEITGTYTWHDKLDQQDANGFVADPYGLQAYGLDLGGGGGYGYSIHAAAAGRISFRDGCGVVIDHENGYATGYYHITPNVSRGERVSAGQQIGVTANCGNMDGAHLHWQLNRWLGELPIPNDYPGNQTQYASNWEAVPFGIVCDVNLRLEQSYPDDDLWLALGRTIPVIPCQESLAEKIDEFLRSRNSPLAGYGQEFVDSGRTHNVDPRLIVAIAGAESSFGTANCQQWASADLHNAWGYMYWPNDVRTCRPFDNWEAGIEQVTWQIGTGAYYFTEGRDTIEEIGGTYCGEGCTNWVRNVTTFYTAMGGDPNNLRFPSQENTIYTPNMPAQPTTNQGAMATIQSDLSNQCLEIAGDRNTGNGANVRMWNCNNGTKQAWELVPLSNGTIALRNVESGQCLDQQNWYTNQNGDNLHQWTCHYDATQQFDLQNTSGYSYQLVSGFNGQCVDLENHWTDRTGDNAHLWSCQGQPSQSWKVTHLTSEETQALCQLQAALSACEGVSGVIEGGMIVIETTPTVIINEDGANIRSCENSSCALIATLSAGTTIDVWGELTGEYIDLYGGDVWLQFLYNDQTAFVHSGLTDWYGTPAPQPQNPAPAVPPGAPNSDQDLLPDYQDNCPYVYNPNQADSDGDGIGDACDTNNPNQQPVDSDQDGIADTTDNCPFNYNPDQADWNNNRVGDACDSAQAPSDADADGVADNFDNCPSTYNPDQANSYGDSRGDACESQPAPQAPLDLSAPQMDYPSDQQTLDSAGHYLFRIHPVTGSEGYLWGFFQNGVMVWENSRDEGTLSTNEYGIAPGSVAHSKFSPGPVTVMIRALINGQWTEARTITIYLDCGNACAPEQPAPQPETFNIIRQGRLYWATPVNGCVNAGQSHEWYFEVWNSGRNIWFEFTITSGNLDTNFTANPYNGYYNAKPQGQGYTVQIQARNGTSGCYSLAIRSDNEGD